MTLTLDGHDDFDGVERVETEVVSESSSRGDLAGHSDGEFPKSVSSLLLEISKRERLGGRLERDIWEE